MARRMVVVLSQSPNASADRRVLEEEFATALILESGIDVNVIPHLEHLEPGSTGLLCLDGIGSDLVLASWLETSAAQAALREFGIAGRRGKSAFDPTVDDPLPNEPARRIYFLNLGGDQDVRSLVREICRIRDDAQVQTFDILGVMPPRAIPRPAAPVPVVPLPTPESTLADDQEFADDEMERLVDELDAMDL